MHDQVPSMIGLLFIDAIGLMPPQDPLRQISLFLFCFCRGGKQFNNLFNKVLSTVRFLVALIHEEAWSRRDVGKGEEGVTDRCRM